MAEFPHCDPTVLHAFGECVYCDKFPLDQQARIQRQENFTGHGPDAATANRPLDVINRWPGNRPTSAAQRMENARYWGHFANEMMAERKGAGPHGEVRAWCDRHGGSVDGYYSEFATSGFYIVFQGTDRTRPWPSLFREGEIVVCDACMWADPGYIAVYGEHKIELLEEAN